MGVVISSHSRGRVIYHINRFNEVHCRVSSRAFLCQCALYLPFAHHPMIDIIPDFFARARSTTGP